MFWHVFGPPISIASPIQRTSGDWLNLESLRPQWVRLVNSAEPMNLAPAEGNGASEAWGDLLIVSIFLTMFETFSFWAKKCKKDRMFSTLVSWALYNWFLAHLAQHFQSIPFTNLCSLVPYHPQISLRNVQTQINMVNNQPIPTRVMPSQGCEDDWTRRQLLQPFMSWLEGFLEDRWWIGLDGQSVLSTKTSKSGNLRI